MNPFEMMKNLGNMKEQLQQAQSKLVDITASGSSGGNMVKVTLNGRLNT